MPQVICVHFYQKNQLFRDSLFYFNPAHLPHANHHPIYKLHHSLLRIIESEISGIGHILAAVFFSIRLQFLQYRIGSWIKNIGQQIVCKTHLLHSDFQCDCIEVSQIR